MRSGPIIACSAFGDQTRPGAFALVGCRIISVPVVVEVFSIAANVHRVGVDDLRITRRRVILRSEVAVEMSDVSRRTLSS